MNNEQIKPLSLRYYDCINQICDAINTSQLPAFIVVQILKNLSIEAEKQASEEFQRDTAQHQEQLNAQKNDTE